jgi:uncharacterized protein
MTPWNDTPAQVESPASSRHHILVTGGTGFLGQALCGMLLAQGHQLTLWARNAAKVRQMYGQAVQCVSTLSELAPDVAVDAILNLSGEPVLGPRWSHARQQVLHASRSGVTQALVDWVGTAQHRPAWLLSASAIGYYGVQAAGNTAALGEDAPPQAIFMSELCQRWERTAEGMGAHGVAVAVMRLGVVLGSQGALPKMLQPFRLGLGVQMGRGDQMLSWIHLDDVLGAVDHLMGQWQATPAHPPAGAYNLTAPHPVSQREFTQTACKVLRRPLSIPVPAPLLGLMLGEQAALLTQGQRVVPQRLLAEGYRFRFDRFEAALRAVERLSA